MRSEDLAQPQRFLVCRVGDSPNSFEAALTTLGIPFDVFKAIDLEPLRPSAAELALFDTLDAHTLLCFVSANAVRFALSSLESVAKTIPVAAVGQKTALALRQAQFTTICVPELSEDTEGLLASLDQSGWVLRRALIIKGEGGRDALQVGLSARGIEVYPINFYRRRPSPSAPKALIEGLERRIWAGVCAMSNEVIEATLNAFGPQHRQALCSLPWLVTHPRQAEFAKQLGLKRVWVQRPNDPQALGPVLTQLSENAHED